MNFYYEGVLGKMNSDVKLPTSLDDVLLPEESPPLVLTAFTRPDLLKDVLEGISQQSLLPSKMIAFVDSPRNVNDKPLIEQCISLLKDFSTLILIVIWPIKPFFNYNHTFSAFKQQIGLVKLEVSKSLNKAKYDKILLFLAYTWHN